MACARIRFAGSPDDEHAIRTCPRSVPFTASALSGCSSGMDFGITGRRETTDLVKAGVRRPVVIPTCREVPVFIIKNLLWTSGLSRDRYFELINDAYATIVEDKRRQ